MSRCTECKYLRDPLCWVCEQKDLARRFHALESDIAKLRALDPRWRPMRTAPRDGTVCEVLNSTGTRSFIDFRYADPELSARYVGYRIAHPEWQEESG